MDLCELLEVEKPHPTQEQAYEFERPVTFTHGDGSTSAGRIDLYRRGCFVLESKKIRGSVSKQKMDESLLRARSQAENYARALPADEAFEMSRLDESWQIARWGEDEESAAATAAKQIEAEALAKWFAGLAA